MIEFKFLSKARQVSSLSFSRFLYVVCTKNMLLGNGRSHPFTFGLVLNCIFHLCPYPYTSALSSREVGEGGTVGDKNGLWIGHTGTTVSGE